MSSHTRSKVITQLAAALTLTSWMSVTASETPPRYTVQVGESGNIAPSAPAAIRGAGQSRSINNQGESVGAYDRNLDPDSGTASKSIYPTAGYWDNKRFNRVVYANGIFHLLDNRGRVWNALDGTPITLMTRTGTTQTQVADTDGYPARLWDLVFYKVGTQNLPLLVGARSTIFNHDQMRWSQWANQTHLLPTLRSIAVGTAQVGTPALVFAVGLEGVILVSDDGGAAWDQVNPPSPTSKHLYGVAMSGSLKGVAVGAGGTLLRWAKYNEEMQWRIHTKVVDLSNAPVSVTEDLMAVVKDPSVSDNYWVVGAKGTLLRGPYGLQWKKIPLQTGDGSLITEDLWSISCAGGMLTIGASGGKVIRKPADESSPATTVVLAFDQPFVINGASFVPQEKPFPPVLGVAASADRMVAVSGRQAFQSSDGVVWNRLAISSLQSATEIGGVSATSESSIAYAINDKGQVAMESTSGDARRPLAAEAARSAIDDNKATGPVAFLGWSVEARIPVEDQDAFMNYFRLTDPSMGQLFAGTGGVSVRSIQGVNRDRFFNKLATLDVDDTDQGFETLQVGKANDGYNVDDKREIFYWRIPTLGTHIENSWQFPVRNRPDDLVVQNYGNWTIYVDPDCLVRVYSDTLNGRGTADGAAKIYNTRTFESDTWRGTTEHAVGVDEAVADLAAPEDMHFVRPFYLDDDGNSRTFTSYGFYLLKYLGEPTTPTDTRWSVPVEPVLGYSPDGNTIAYPPLPDAELIGYRLFFNPDSEPWPADNVPQAGMWMRINAIRDINDDAGKWFMVIGSDRMTIKEPYPSTESRYWPYVDIMADNSIDYVKGIPQSNDSVWGRYPKGLYFSDDAVERTKRLHALDRITTACDNQGDNGNRTTGAIFVRNTIDVAITCEFFANEATKGDSYRGTSTNHKFGYASSKGAYSLNTIDGDSSYMTTTRSLEELIPINDPYHAYANRFTVQSPSPYQFPGEPFRRWPPRYAPPDPVLGPNNGIEYDILRERVTGFEVGVTGNWYGYGDRPSTYAHHFSIQPESLLFEFQARSVYAPHAQCYPGGGGARVYLDRAIDPSGFAGHLSTSTYPDGCWVDIIRDVKNLNGSNGTVPYPLAKETTLHIPQDPPWIRPSWGTALQCYNTPRKFEYGSVEGNPYIVLNYDPDRNVVAQSEPEVLQVGIAGAIGAAVFTPAAELGNPTDALDWMPVGTRLMAKGRDNEGGLFEYAGRGRIVPFANTRVVDEPYVFLAMVDTTTIRIASVASDTITIDRGDFEVLDRIQIGMAIKCFRPNPDGQVYLVDGTVRSRALTNTQMVLGLAWNSSLPPRTGYQYLTVCDKGGSPFAVAAIDTPSSRSLAINQDGWKAGSHVSYVTQPDGTVQGFDYQRYWDVRSELLDMPSLGSKQGVATAISNRKFSTNRKHIGCEEVAGYATNELAQTRTMLYKPTHFNDTDMVVRSSAYLLTPGNDDNDQNCDQEETTPFPWSRNNKLFNPDYSIWQWHSYDIDRRYVSWTVGSNGAIYFDFAVVDPQTGLDLYRSYLKQESGTSVDLYAVDFIDWDPVNFNYGQRNFARGIAVGQQGTILWTNDGGVSWNRGVVVDEGGAAVVMTADLFGLEFCECADGNAWAVGAGGIILKSADFGQTWVRQVSGVPDDLYDISIDQDGIKNDVFGFLLPSGILWAVGDGHVLRTTSNGSPQHGENGKVIPGWSAVLDKDLAQQIWYAVDFFSDGYVFLGGERGIARAWADPTRPDGINGAWERQTDAAVYDLNAYCSNYYWGTGLPATGNIPDEGLAPAKGDWAGFTCATGLPPDVVAVGEKGRVWRRDPWGAGWFDNTATDITQDNRGVCAYRFNLMVDLDGNLAPDDAFDDREDGRNRWGNGGRDGYFESQLAQVAATDGSLWVINYVNDVQPGQRGSWTYDLHRPPNRYDPPMVTQLFNAPGWLMNAVQGNPLPFPEMGNMPWLWERALRATGNSRDLGAMFGQDSISKAWGINDKGFIVGEVSLPNGSRRATMLRRQQSSTLYDPMIDLGTLGGSEAVALSIENTMSRIVGWSRDPRGRQRGFLIENGVMQDLNSLLYGSSYAVAYDQNPAAAPERFLVTQATDINEYGEIAAIGFVDVNRNGQQDADEPDRPCTLDPMTEDQVNDPPSVVIVHPANGEIFGSSLAANQPNNITLSALARDANGRMRSVEFYGVDLGNRTTFTMSEAITGGGGGAGMFTTRWAAPTGITVNQRYAVYARAVDDLGAISVSEPVIITIVPNTNPGWLIGDLGTLGGDGSRAADINNRNQTVGVSQDKNGNWLPFVWSEDLSMRLLPQAGLAEVEPVAINDYGEIAGHGKDSSGKRRALLWRRDAEGQYGEPLMLGGQGEFWQRADITVSDINIFGQIVGTAEVQVYDEATSTKNLIISRMQLAWYWRNAQEGMVSIGTLGGPESRAEAINVYRRIVGTSSNRRPIEHGFYWDRGFPSGAMTDIQPAGLITRALDINYAGSIVGATQIGNRPQDLVSFLWTESGGLVQLPTTAAYVASQAIGLNDGESLISGGQLLVLAQATAANGETTGYLVGSNIDQGQPVGVWSITLPGGNTALAVRLNDLVTAEGWTNLTKPSAVNNTRVVVGTGLGSNGKDRAFYMRPGNFRAGNPSADLGNTPPTVAMITPQTDYTFAADQEVMLSAVAGDGDGKVVKVDFWIGGAETNDNHHIASVTQASEASGAVFFYHRWTTPQIGDYYIVAVATDDKGATAVSARIPVHGVQFGRNRAPTIAINLPRSGVMVTPLDKVNDDRLTDAIRVQLDALDDVDNDGDLELVPNRMVEGSSIIGIDDPGTPQDDRNTDLPFQAVIDAQGNLNVTVQILANDLDQGDAVTKVALYDNQVLVAESRTETGPGVWQLNINRVGVGSHNLSAIAFDKQGTIGTATTVSFYVHAFTGLRFGPSVPPQVTLIVPVNGNAFYFSTTASFPLQALAQGNDAQIAQVTFYVQNGDRPYPLQDSLLGIVLKANSIDGKIFGGTASFAQPADVSQPVNYRIYAVAEDEQGAVGWTDTVTITLVPAGDRGFLDTDIGDLAGGGRASRAYDINARGDVTGEAQDESGAWWPFVWRMGQSMRKLELAGIQGAKGGGGRGINDSGDVVGEVTTRSNVTHGFHYEQKSGRYTELSVVGQDDLAVYPGKVNGFNQVVGVTNSNGSWRGFAWQKGRGTQLLTTLGGDACNAQGVNLAGQIVGVAYRRDQERFMVRWDESYPTRAIIPYDLQGPGFGRAVNYDGSIVGFSDDNFCPLLWSPGSGLVLIGGDPAVLGLDVKDMNDSGTMVGQGSAGAMMLFKPDLAGNYLITTLFNQVPASSGWTSMDQANAVNNALQVVGTGVKNGRERAFLVRPINPPDFPPSAFLVSPADQAVYRVTDRPEDLAGDELQLLPGGNLMLRAIAFDVPNVFPPTNNGTVLPSGIAKVDFWINQKKVGTQELPSVGEEGSSFTFLLPVGDLPLGDSTLEIIAVAVDAMGLTGESVRRSVQIHNGAGQAPNVEITQPLTGAKMKIGTKLQVMCTANDDSAVSRIEIWQDSTLKGTIQGSGQTVQGSLQIEVTEGSHELVAIAYDPQNLVSRSKPVLIYGDPYGDNRPPMIEMFFPTAGMVLRSGDVVTPSALAIDVDGKILDVFFQGMAVPSPVVTLLDSDKQHEYFPGPWTVPAVSQETIHYVAATARDDLGATTTAFVPITIIPASSLALLTPLPGLVDNGASEAMAINDAGQIVGKARIDTGNWHGCAWWLELQSNPQQVRCVDMGIPSNPTTGEFLGDYSEAVAISRYGRIVGRAGDSSKIGRTPLGQYAVWSKMDTRPVGGWQVGPLDLMFPASAQWGTGNEAWGLNDLGQVVGSATIQGDTTSHAFVLNLMGLNSAKAMDLGTLGGASSVARSLNDGLQVVGGSMWKTGKDAPFLWQVGEGVPSMSTWLDQMNYSSAVAISVNQQGAAVGQARDNNQQAKAFRYRKDLGMLTLQAVGGESKASGACYIGDDGVIVGWSQDAEDQQVATLWSTATEPPTPVDLNTWLPADSGWRLTKANGCNQRGAIVGVGEYQGSAKAFLLRRPLGGTANIAPGDAGGLTVMLVQPSSDVAMAVGDTMTLRAITRDIYANSRMKVQFMVRREGKDEAPRILGLVSELNEEDGIWAFSMPWKPDCPGTWIVSVLAVTDSGETGVSQNGSCEELLRRVTVTGEEPIGSPTITLNIDPEPVGGSVDTNDGVDVKVGDETINMGSGRSRTSLAFLANCTSDVKEVRFVVDGKQIERQVVDVPMKGPFKYTWTGVIDGIDAGVSGIDAGTYICHVIGITQDGVQVVSSGLVFSVNGRPQVTISKPTDNLNFELSAGGALAITAQASDNEGRVESVVFLAANPAIDARVLYNTLEYVELSKVPGFLLIGEDKDPSDGWAYSWTEMRLGRFQVLAVATDSHGKRGVSAPVLVNVVRSPRISIVSDPGPVATGNSQVTINAGTTWMYRVMLETKELPSGASIKYGVSLLDPDGKMRTAPAGLTVTDDGVVRWDAIPVPANGSYHRILVRAWADDSNPNTADPMDIQAVLIHIQPASSN